MRSRRSFLKTVGSVTALTLAPKVIAATKELAAVSDLPLTLRISGPFVYKQLEHSIVLWTPKMPTTMKHEAALGTEVEGRVLGINGENDYLLGPSVQDSTMKQEYVEEFKPLEVSGDEATVKRANTNKAIRIEIPLATEARWCNPVNTLVEPGARASHFPTILTLRYTSTATWTLRSRSKPNDPLYELKFPSCGADPCRRDFGNFAEIIVAPLRHGGYGTGDKDADESFAKSAEMIGSSVRVQINPKRQAGEVTVLNGPLHNCKAPLLVLSSQIKSSKS